MHNENYTNQYIERFNSIRYCSICGSEINFNLKFCLFCGTKNHYINQNSKLNNNKCKLKVKKSKLKNSKVKPPLNIIQIIIGAIFSIILGILMIKMPFEELNRNLSIEMIEWLYIAGVFTIIRGLFGLVQGIVRFKYIFGQKILISAQACLDLLFIPYLIKIGEILSGITYINTIELESREIILKIFQYFPIIITLIFIISLIEFIYKIVTLRYKYDKFLVYKELNK